MSSGKINKIIKERKDNGMYVVFQLFSCSYLPSFVPQGQGGLRYRKSQALFPDACDFLLDFSSGRH
jgi:hypothetical protein